MTAPEEEGQKDHEKRVGAEVGRKGKVRIQRRSTDFLLHPGKVWRFISDQREQFLSRPVAPEG